MQVIAVMNYKGGVGKTTLTANLATQLAMEDKKVLMIDMDSQASLTLSFMNEEELAKYYYQHKTIKSWFDAIIDSDSQVRSLDELIVRPTALHEKGHEIDLICSHLDLIHVDLELAVLLGGANTKQTSKNYLKVHEKLRSAIQNDLKELDYDVVFIDCPPNFNIVTKNALLAASHILVPTKPDYLSTIGIDYLIKNTHELIDEINRYHKSLDANAQSMQYHTLAIVFTMVQIKNNEPIGQQRDYINKITRLAIKNDIHVLEPPCFLSENKTIFGEAASTRIPYIANIDMQRRFSGETYERLLTEIQNISERISKIFTIGE